MLIEDVTGVGLLRILAMAPPGKRSSHPGSFPDAQQVTVSETARESGTPPRIQRFLKRRNFLVNRSLQLGLLKAHLILFSASIAFLTVGMFAPLVADLNGTGEETSDSVSTANAMLYMHEHLWALMGFTILFLCLGLLRLSHKIAGPLHRFRSALEDLARGDPAREIHLRRGDSLKEEAQQLNRLILVSQFV